MAGQVADDLLEALLSVAGQQPGGNAGVEPDRVSEYDFHSPRRYTDDAADRLEKALAHAARAVGEALAATVGEVCDLKPRLTQHYRMTAQERTQSITDYAVPLRHGDRAVGVLVVPSGKAVCWTERLLGGTGETPEERQLSRVELAILADAGATVLSAFCAGLGLEPDTVAVDENIKAGGVELPGDDAVEYSWISLDTEETPALLTLVMFSELLDAPAGKTEDSAAGGGEEGEDRQRILWHLENTPIRADACIGSAELPMGELVSLQPGDVLLLDRFMGETIEMNVQGTKVLQGVPVQCEGRYAVQVEAVLEPDQVA